MARAPAITTITQQWRTEIEGRGGTTGVGGLSGEAGESGEEELAGSNRPKGSDPLDTFNSLSHLGNWLYSRHLPALAEALFASLVTYARVTTASPEMLAMTLNSLGALYSDLNRFSEAEKYLLEALGIQRSTLAPDHPDLAGTLTNLGALYYTLNHFPEAKACYLEALGIFRSASWPDHPDMASTLTNLGALYSDLNRFSEAEKYLLEALGIQRRALAPDHPDLASTLNNLGVLYRDQNRFPEAEECYLEALRIRRTALAPDHPDLASTLNNLGVLYEALGRPDEAALYRQEAAEILSRQVNGTSSSINHQERNHVDPGELTQRYITAIGQELGVTATVDNDSDVTFNVPNLGTFYFSIDERDPSYVMLVFPAFADKASVSGDTAYLLHAANHVNQQKKGVKISVSEDERSYVNATIEFFAPNTTEGVSLELLSGTISRVLSAIVSGITVNRPGFCE